MSELLIKNIGTKDYELFFQELSDLVAKHCYSFEIEDASQLEPPVIPKIAEDKSLQPMKDFEKEFLYNWTIEAIKDDKELFYRVKHWIGEWCEKNIGNFSG